MLGLFLWAFNLWFSICVCLFLFRELFSQASSFELSTWQRKRRSEKREIKKTSQIEMNFLKISQYQINLRKSGRWNILKFEGIEYLNYAKTS
mgnify:CR=1 FL=1